MLEIPVNLQLAFTIRLGYPFEDQGNLLRVRRDLVDFTHHNKFGEKGFD